MKMLTICLRLPGWGYYISIQFLCFIWNLIFVKIRTNLLRTVLHKVIFFIFNISLIILTSFLIENRLSWDSENLGYMIRLLSSIFVLIFTPELRDSKGKRKLSVYFEYYSLLVLLLFSSVSFGRGLSIIIIFASSIIQTLI